MLGPNDLKSKLDIQELIYQIDESMKKFHGWYLWESAILESEIPVEIRNKIAVEYIKAGWNYVYHITTTENGERAGLTSFDFSSTPLEKPKENAFVVMKSAVNPNEFVVYKQDNLIMTITN